MPNWCYNYTTLDINDEYFHQVNNCVRSIKHNNKNKTVKKIPNYKIIGNFNKNIENLFFFILFSFCCFCLNYTQRLNFF